MLRLQKISGSIKKYSQIFGCTFGQAKGGKNRGRKSAAAAAIIVVTALVTAVVIVVAALVTAAMIVVAVLITVVVVAAVCIALIGAIQEAAGQPTGMGKGGPKEVAAIGGITSSAAVLVTTKGVFPGAERGAGDGGSIANTSAAALWGNGFTIMCRGKINGIATVGEIVGKTFAGFGDLSSGCVI